MFNSRIRCDVEFSVVPVNLPRKKRLFRADKGLESGIRDRVYAGIGVNAGLPGEFERLTKMMPVVKALSDRFRNIGMGVFLFLRKHIPDTQSVDRAVANRVE